MNVHEWTPGQILDISSSYWQTCTLHAGVKLDIFTLIGDAELTSADVAQKLNAEERAVGMFLNALTALKLLVKRGDSYANTSAARTSWQKTRPSTSAT